MCCFWNRVGFLNRFWLRLWLSCDFREKILALRNYHNGGGFCNLCLLNGSCKNSSVGINILSPPVTCFTYLL